MAAFQVSSRTETMERVIQNEMTVGALIAALQVHKPRIIKNRFPQKKSQYVAMLFCDFWEQTKIEVCKAEHKVLITFIPRKAIRSQYCSRDMIESPLRIPKHGLNK